MKKMVLHIPHASTDIPDFHGYVATEENIKNEIVKLTDWYTDELFENQTDDCLVAPFSRLFCDVERFPDDKDEVMAQYGMGAIYTKLDSGKPLRSVSPELRSNILEKYYWSHHNQLQTIVDRHIKETGSCLIIDCHSFPDKPLNRELDKSLPRPDFNIGIDSFHTPKKLTKLAAECFHGYSVFVDKPFSGTIVPQSHYRKDKRVYSIMLEVNRRLYLKEPTQIKSKDFEGIKKVIQSFLDIMRSYEKTN